MLPVYSYIRLPLSTVQTYVTISVLSWQNHSRRCRGQSPPRGKLGSNTGVFDVTTDDVAIASNDILVICICYKYHFRYVRCVILVVAG